MSESDLQRSVCQYLEILVHQGRLRYFSPQAEGKKSPKRAGIAKAMGLKSGVADLVIMLRADFQPTVLFIELKTAKGKLWLK